MDYYLTAIMKRKKILILITIAILLKSSLFLFSTFKTPELKISADTYSYLESGLSMVSSGVFGTINEDGSHSYQYYRTPGYPLFLGIFHGFLKIPLNGVVYLQIILTLLSAAIVFKTATMISPQLGTIAFIIILFDPAITIYSLILLTESLFLFLMSIFMYAMITYLQGRNKKYLLLSALTLAAATYVRPITFYLGGILAVFIFAASVQKNPKKGIIHACIFIVTVYSLLFLWQYRNYTHFKEFQFSNINNATINLKGLYKSYKRNEDPISQGLPPVAYYVNVGSRNLMSLMTRPASFKNFNSPNLKKAGKVFSYPWIAFWLIGFFLGIRKAGKNFSFHFLLIVILYLMGATIIGTMWGSGPRFRIPMMPYIAILSAYGWSFINKKKVRV